ncbi:MAG: c-type cytochrome [Akkermansiaceae bacterium]|nr:c-type cytochrome [Akkermansiaceae bacterium]
MNTLHRLLVSATATLPCWVADPTLFAQRGDRAGHEMDPPPAHWKIPAAPVVTADRALATFAVPEGFRVELVAAEPVIHDPVALVFDGNGRLWVAEMRGYMAAIDGKGEEKPVGRVSVLEDTDGDGRIDRHAVFVDGIVMPRAVALTDADRTLVYADELSLHAVEILEDGQGGLPRAGKTAMIASDYAKGGNPEHKPNGFRHALDNWFYSAKSDVRYRHRNGEWLTEKTEFRGQWGIDEDDRGRLFTNTNSNAVLAEEVPPGVTVRNPNHAFTSRVSTKMNDQRLHPSRINPGVNRGYMQGVLDEEGYLTKPTAASGLSVYRGDQFPAEFHGNLFINEPGANLVKRGILTEKDGRFTIEPADADREFFTSTDERSRIVNSYTAPDGTLYLVDFYRGILQHAAYMTTFLRRQVEERGLDKPVGLGRVWRIVHEGKPRGAAPRMHEESSAELVKHLEHPNGWWRETARRLIVERGGEEAVPALREAISGTPEAAIHAVWALEGLGKLTAEDVAAASQAGPEVFAQAVRASESLAGDEAATARLLKTFEEHESDATAAPPLRRQLLASLGVFAAGPSAQTRKAAHGQLHRLADSATSDREEAKLCRDLALSGLGGGEADFLQYLLAEDAGNALREPLIAAVVKAGGSAEVSAMEKSIFSNEKLPAETVAAAAKEMAQAAAKLRRGPLATELLASAGENDALVGAVADGLLAGKKAVGSKFKPMMLKARPGTFDMAVAKLDKKKRESLETLFDFSGAEEVSYLKTEADRKQFESGREHYARLCFACHQPTGLGQSFLAPPLVDSEWVLGSKSRLIGIVLDGVAGPITVDGKEYKVPEIQPEMPGIRANPDFTDEHIAAILTYVRNEWGNAAPTVSTEEVKAYREKNAARSPQTEEELKKIE